MRNRGQSSTSNAHLCGYVRIHQRGVAMVFRYIGDNRQTPDVCTTGTGVRPRVLLWLAWTFRGRPVGSWLLEKALAH